MTVSSTPQLKRCRQDVTAEIKWLIKYVINSQRAVCLSLGGVGAELRRPRPAPQVVAFVAGQPLDLLFVSTVTLSEIRFGIELVTDANRRAELNGWLTHKVRSMFEERTLPVSEDIMFTWRLLVEECRKFGHTFSQPDLIIAAMGLHHGLTVVTRDTGDYANGASSAIRPVARLSASCRVVTVAYHTAIAGAISGF
ncbi:type II toxin-antitoxin system VapC family toxin [Candidatus Accumulibacter phosphatis]|uniref:Type II toxin-antitoxin system VapC family toxin n=1 Tax=Candidatus Accumulibacter phosphatis TaxID=327160 RepID=A0ABX1TZI4_9PROT|nr:MULTISPECIES: PIN domain-containing protein [Candidatus Accumulibacter]NMQ29681.1 type II toxin-antitoxin system VapC family toxin [Candidatus Accumulibacter phosphatis]